MRVESASGDRLKSRLNVTSGLEGGGGGGGRELRTTVAVFEEVKNRVDRNYKTFPGKMNENICSYCGDRYILHSSRYTICQSTWLPTLTMSVVAFCYYDNVLSTATATAAVCAKTKLMSIWENWHLFPLSLWKHKHELLNFYFPRLHMLHSQPVRHTVGPGGGGALVWRWWRRCYRRKGVFPTRRRSRQEAVPYG